MHVCLGSEKGIAFSLYDRSSLGWSGRRDEKYAISMGNAEGCFISGLPTMSRVTTRDRSQVELKTVLFLAFTASHATKHSS